MSTEVATREDIERANTQLATKNDDAPVDPAFETAKRQAIALSQSDLVPQDFRGKVANCLLALELAQRLGCPPMAVMQNLHVVQGKPAFSATFLIACVNQSSEFTRLTYRFEGERDTDEWGCRAVARDADTGEELVGTLITLGMAKAEKWGPKWRTMPEQMLQYRAAAFWSRTYAPHLTMGMHLVDELEDIGGGGSVEADVTEALNAALEDVGPEPTDEPNDEPGPDGGLFPEDA